jgi:hypothetical protein
MRMEPWKAILIGAAGTWVVAVMAVFGDGVKSWYRPKLNVGKGEFSNSLAMHGNGQSARYYIVPVANERRAVRPAHEVQLVLTRIEKSGAKGIETIFDEIMPLAWQRQELHTLLTRTVGTDAIAGLFFVQQDGLLGITPALSPRGELASHFPREHRGPTTLWISLQALSNEADSTSIRLKIEWDGQWRDDKVGLEGVCRVSVDPFRAK